MLQSTPWCLTDIKNANGNTAKDMTAQNVKIATLMDKANPQDLKRHLEGREFDFYDKHGNNLLHLCVLSETCVREKIEIVHRKYPALINESNNKGYFPIHSAAEQNNVQAVETLLLIDCVNKLSHKKQTPLHIASYHGCTELVKLLLFKNIFVNMQDIDGNTAAHLSARNDHIESLFHIEQHPQYIEEIKNKSGNSPYSICPSIQSLTLFCSTGSASSVTSMLQNMGKFLKKPLHATLLSIVLQSKTERIQKLEAILHYCPEAIEGYFNEDKRSILHVAASEEEVHLLGQLLNQFAGCAIIDSIDQHGHAALDYTSTWSKQNRAQLSKICPLLDEVIIHLNLSKLFLSLDVICLGHY